ncbi:MAG: permease [Candidatus Zixiibacteriota bacterium]|nr:MAG: permease [candidate division Zixibacteria bacterium]
MSSRKDLISLLSILAVFLIFFFVPLESPTLDNPVGEALRLTQWYAREHVILCLVPAFFIAGAIAVFLGQASVMKYLGAKANKVMSYGVASVSGAILAVCSCTILPLFAGIYGMGAGLGPASAFLYAGPAVNVLAIILTARILGLELGIARAVGAIVFSIVIGLLMQLIFRKEEKQKVQAQAVMPQEQVTRPLWKNIAYFASMIAILVFATWSSPEQSSGLWHAVYSVKWLITAAVAVVFGVLLVCWLGLCLWKVALTGLATTVFALVFSHQPLVPFGVAVVGLSLSAGTGKGEARSWVTETWGFARQIMPLLFIGVLIAGLLLGRPGSEGLVPSHWVSGAVGGNSVGANLFASVAGAFMYFATLTEVPILQGLIGNGMGKGPALALLLAGPALSLPNMLVIRSVMGTKKTIVFVTLVVIMATISGLVYGALF